MDSSAWDTRYADRELVWTSEAQPLPRRRDGGARSRRGRSTSPAARAATRSGSRERGWEVTGVDFSKVGLEKASRLADARASTLSGSRLTCSTTGPSRGRSTSCSSSTCRCPEPNVSRSSAPPQTPSTAGRRVSARRARQQQRRPRSRRPAGSRRPLHRQDIVADLDGQRTGDRAGRARRQTRGDPRRRADGARRARACGSSLRAARCG